VVNSRLNGMFINGSQVADDTDNRKREAIETSDYTVIYTAFSSE